MPDTPLTPKYPAALDTPVSLGEVRNDAGGVLSAPVTPLATVIPLAAAGLPATGVLAIDAELVAYNERTDTQVGTVANPALRGVQGTAAGAHAAGASADVTITAGHHEALRGAVIALETKLGANVPAAQGTPVADTFLRGAAGGQSSWGALVAGDLPAHSAALLTSGTLGVQRGGTGLSTVALGDIVYGSAADTLARLPGSTAAAKRFLTQTGTGTVSAAPAWSALASGDVTGALGFTPRDAAAATVSTFNTRSGAVTLSATDVQNAFTVSNNTVFAGSTLLGEGQPSFRALVADDLPATLNATAFAGHVTPSGDNTRDLGTSSARFRTGYFGTSLLSGTDGGASIGAAAANRFNIFAYGLGVNGAAAQAGEARFNVGANAVRISNAFLDLGSSVHLRMSAGDPSSVAADAGLLRSAAGVIKGTNGSTGYGIFDASAYRVSGTLMLDSTGAALLQGQNSAYHLARGNHTGTQLSATISDATDQPTASVIAKRDGSGNVGFTSVRLGATGGTVLAQVSGMTDQSGPGLSVTDGAAGYGHVFARKLSIGEQPASNPQGANYDTGLRLTTIYSNLDGGSRAKWIGLYNFSYIGSMSVSTPSTQDFYGTNQQIGVFNSDPAQSAYFFNTIFASYNVAFHQGYNSIGNLIGLTGYAYHQGYGTVTTMLRGMTGWARTMAGGTTVQTLPAAIGGRFVLDNANAYITMTKGAALEATVNSNAATITNAYGLIVTNVAIGGGGTGKYGVFIEAQTVGTPANWTSLYNFYSQGATSLNRIEGELQVKTLRFDDNTTMTTAASGGGLTINPTNGVIPKRSSATAFADSTITDTGFGVSVAGHLNLSDDTYQLGWGSGYMYWTSGVGLRMLEDASTGWSLQFDQSGFTQTRTLTLPDASGTVLVSSQNLGGLGNLAAARGNLGLGTSDAVQHGSLGLGQTPTAGVALAVTGHIATALYAGGTVGGTVAVNFNNGNRQAFTLSGAVTFTFSNGVAGSTYTLEVVQDATGGRVYTWPASVKWEGGVAPTHSTAASKIDLFTFFYDGTYYLGTYSVGY